MGRLIANFVIDATGTVEGEYALLMVLIAAAIAGSLAGLGNDLRPVFTTLASPS